MENSALRYKIYRVLLESDLTNEQREIVLEGWFDNLKSWLGAAKDTGQTDVGKIFANNKFNRRVKYAAENITKEIEDLKSIAKDAGVAEEAALEMLDAILKGAGADPGKISKASASPSTSGESGGSSGGKSSGGGTETVTPSTAAESPSLLSRLLAAMSGKKGDEAAAEAEEKKLSAKNIMSNYVSLLSKTSGVDETKTKKILKALMDGGHIEIGGLPESFRNRGKNLVLGNSMRRDPMLEKWNRLAGLKIINEDRYADTFASEIKTLISNKKLKSADDLIAHLENEISGLGAEGEDALADIEKNKEKIIQTIGLGGTTGRKLPSALDDAIEAAKKKVSKPTAAEDSDSPAAGDGGGEAKSSESEIKEYGKAFKDVRDKLKDAKEITDDEILKVIKTIDIKDSEGAEVSIKK